MKEYDEKEIEKQVQRHLKRNWFCSYMDGIFIIGGMGFVALPTILTYFASEFTDSRVIIGMLTSISLLGKYLPQMFGAKILEGTSHNKKYVSIFGFLQRVPWFIMAFITYSYGKQNPTFTLAAFYLLYGFYTVTSGMFSPGWLDLIAKVIPVNLRGRFFGLRKFIGGGMQFIGSFAVAWLFRRFLFPMNYTLAFLIAGVMSSVSYLFLISMKEVGKPRNAKDITMLEYLKRLPVILKGDKNFTRYIVSAAFIVFFNMANAFYIIYGKEQLNIGPETIGVITGILLATQSIFSVVWGYISDKSGHKAILVISTVLFISSAFMILIADTIYLLYLVFFLNGAAISSRDVSEMNMVIEFCSEDERPTYLGLTNTLIAPLMSLTPLLGGIILDYFSYRSLMAVSIVLMMIGLYILVFHVKDPRRIKAKKL
ncbi:MFS transporter [Irregularibacter muris]|uniref:MFS transporter n=1 Tax=Irregularibacter muris TaxID=1796619 RepID=A0AAE3HEM4_9FIRM|nr:MFS transporter [Irregularibacter muris]MCR1897733.1 MFS transporter [Irregularibacter muris]